MGCMQQLKSYFKILILIFVCQYAVAQKDFGEHQPFSSYWFINELLEWNPNEDNNVKFNKSYLPLQDRFVDSTTQVNSELSTEPPSSP